MNSSWQKLYQNDNGLAEISNSQALIDNGLAPLIALMTDHKSDIVVKKANLLEQAKYKNWQQKASQLCSCFEQNQINFLILKGLAYSHILYDGHYVRPYSDIDIFIDRSDYQQVSTLLKSLGYQRYMSRQGQFVSFQNSFFDDEVPQTVIDVHWQINNRIEFHRYFPFKSLYASAVCIDTGHMKFRTLNDIDSFILACFHYHAHRHEHKKRIWLYDLALLWMKMNHKQQEKCLKKAQEVQQMTIVISTLMLLEETFTGGFELGEMNRAHLSLALNKDEITAHYVNERKTKLKDIKTRMKNINGIKNKTIFISEYLFQPKSYVQERFNLTSTHCIYCYYPIMWFQDLIKLFK